MAMSSFDKDMNIIQKLNDEPNDRDGLTAGELKAKFDEGGLAVKGYLNNTVRTYVNGLDNDKYDKTGGTLSGNVIVVQDDAVAPSLQLKGQEKSGVGRAGTTINKNASAASDSGTQIIDYNWGATDQLRLIVQATAAAMKEKVRLYYKEGSASAVTYYLYGTHNPPAVADVTGLQAALDAGAGALTDHESNTSNPHQVTKAQVGLGDVPNVTTNNQTPTYTEASSLTALTSGEKLNAAFGKIKKAVSSLISHLADTSNPHSVTKTQVGLGNVPNVATNDQTPTYTAASSNTALSSGEKLSVAFGKIAKAVSSLISHLADTTSHITASERTTWNGKQNALTFDNSPTSGSANPVKSDGVYTALSEKFDKAGGTVTGDVSIARNDAAAPKLYLYGQTKPDVGRAYMLLIKQSNATADGGTQIIDYTWGATGQLRLNLKAAAATLKELATLYYGPASGSAATYYLYGTHNPPGIADVTGLQTALDGKYVTAGQKSGTTLGYYATAEGNETTASGSYCAHAEGYRTTASGNFGAHAEGADTVASGAQSHAEGDTTTASGASSHAEGYHTTASGNFGAHAEGRSTTASGASSHAEGEGTIAAGANQHVFGKYNVSDTSSVEIVGWGTSSTRKNIRTLASNGNMTIAGTLTQSSDARLKDVQGEIPDVSGVRAVKFRWNDQKGEHDEKDHIGYLAQDVEQVAPYLVGKDSSGYKSLDYIAFLCAKIEGLERRVAELESRE